ncbi:MAG: zinc-binding dehydrogenase [Anaerolineales bacterium]|nr:zinc-binding dehydrogenase [Anaerolineales bacterium]
MRAIRLVEPGKPLELQEIEIPEVGANDVLVAVKAAGICHSDAHYRAGRSPVHPLPLTLGHEVSGIVEQVGSEVTSIKAGERVCLHYLVTCGECEYCQRGSEQFCKSGSMIGKYRDGGYAEYIRIPARSVFVLPDEVPFEQGAIMMCSSATSLHAINKSRLKPGESVAVFGVGGLGISAIQLARAYGAELVLAVDINPAKLEKAAHYGAVPVNARETDPVAEIKRLTGGRGVDVALELIGLPLTMQQSVQSLAVLGRAAVAGLTEESFQIAPYQEVINKEAELIGVSDHLAQEIPQLLTWASSGKLDLSAVISQTIPLDAGLINETLDQLESFGKPLRVVITP